MLLQMQSGEPSSPLKIAGPVQLAAFDNRLRCRVLLACGPRERSLSNLARLLDAPLPKLHYHVRRLLGAGLLAIARSQARPGRPIRHYRAVAESFLVPHGGQAVLPGDALAGELRGLLEDERGRGGEMAVLYEAGPEEGSLRMRLIRPESPPSRAFELWRVLHLTPAQRQALAKDLAEMLTRYDAGGPGNGAEPYLAHAAMAPRGGGAR